MRSINSLIAHQLTMGLRRATVLLLAALALVSVNTAGAACDQEKVTQCVQSEAVDKALDVIADAFDQAFGDGFGDVFKNRSMSNVNLTAAEVETLSTTGNCDTILDLYKTTMMCYNKHDCCDELEAEGLVNNDDYTVCEDYEPIDCKNPNSAGALSAPLLRLTGAAAMLLSLTSVFRA